MRCKLLSKVVSCWEDLVGLESEHYKLDINLEYYSGWIKPKVETEETKNNYFEHHKYLSTHTFYRSMCKYSTDLLRSFGFDIVLKSWG